MAPRGRLAWLAVALLLGTTAPARADRPCARTQFDLNQCVGRAFARADTALNAAYKTALDHLTDSHAKAALVVAQKRWLAFRDGECDFETWLSIGGSAHSMAVLGCKAALTEARTQALHRLLSCSEGDLACPIPPR